MAAAVAAAFIVATAALLPRAAGDAHVGPGFIPSYQTALIVIYTLTALLLIAEFRRSRTLAMLLLGAGSALTAAICLLQLLSFPGTLAVGRVFGPGPETTSWLWTFWHLVPPLYAILYVFADRRDSRPPALAGRLLLWSVLGTIGLLGVMVLASSSFVAWLPNSPRPDPYGPFLMGSGIGPAVIVFTLIAVSVAAWRWGASGGVMPLWLMVSMVLLVCDNVLTLAGSSRGSWGWVGGRLEALAAGAVVLAVYLREVDFLHRRAEGALATRDSALAALGSVRDGLELALDAAGMGEWAVDIASGAWTHGPRFDRLFGNPDPGVAWSRETFLRHVVPDDRPYVEQVFVPGRAAPLAFECRIVRADGVERWVAMLGRTYTDGAGQARVVRGVVMDVTERRRTDERLQQSQRLEAIGQLTGGVAHDFNNLLTVVVGSIDMILRAPGDVSRVERLGQAAMQAARRGSGLTAQLLSFSRRQLLRPEHVNPNRLLTHFQELIRRALGETITLRLDLDPTVDPALIDRAGLETALLNLAANARDAIEDCRGDGTVVIRAANETLAAGGQPDGPSSQGHEITPGDYVVVSLSDDGAGMDELTASKAFEPFFTTREIGKGTGLGLSQVYGFARQSGGFVRMRSAPGKGTTVSIYLPRSADRVANAGSGERTAPILLRAASAGEVVLVVEDDDTVRRVAIERPRRTRLPHAGGGERPGRAPHAPGAGPDRHPVLRRGDAGRHERGSAGRAGATAAAEAARAAHLRLHGGGAGERPRGAAAGGGAAQAVSAGGAGEPDTAGGGGAGGVGLPPRLTAPANSGQATWITWTLNRPAASVQVATCAKPAVRASAGNASIEYLHEFSVWIVSPASKSKRCRPTRTVWSTRLTRCISMRLAASFQRASWRNRPGSKSASSSRSMRRSRLRLNAAVTPAASS